MRRHSLKTWPAHFQAIERGEKTFELRRDDRGFAVGDFLCLQEWDPTPVGPALKPSGHTGNSAIYRVTYLLHGGRFGLDADYVAMAIVPAEERDA